MPRQEKSARQSYLIHQMVLGKNLTEIAADLHVSYRTVLRDKADMGYLPIGEELMDKQVQRIAQIQDEGIEMRERRELIKIIRPRQVEAKVESSGKIVIEFVK